MTTVKNNFKSIKKGTTFNGRDIKFYSGTGAEKVPMDLTGVKIEMQFKIDKCEGTAFTFSTENNSIAITGIGVARMMPRLINYSKSNYETDIVLTFPNGTVKNYATINWQIN